MYNEHRTAAYDDDDFELAADDVSVNAMALNDSELLVSVRAWVTKLTSGDRGHNEICYLRMLRRMVVHRRVCWPFVDLPPAGPLLPLSRYLNPPGAPCNEMTRSDWCLVKRFQRETFTRASQTVSGYVVDEREDTKKEEHDDLIDGLADLDMGNGAVVVSNETDVDNGVDEEPNDGGRGTESNDDEDGDVDVAYKNNDDNIDKDGEDDGKDGEDDGEGGEDDVKGGENVGKGGEDDEKGVEDDEKGVEDDEKGVEDDEKGVEDDEKGVEDDEKGVEDDEKGGENNKVEKNQQERIEDDKAKRDEINKVDKVAHED